MLGDRVKIARKGAGYSLRGLSDAVGGGISAQVISKYERGEMFPDTTALIHLMKGLGVSLEYLLSERVEGLEDLEPWKLSGAGARDRARVKTMIMDSLQRYLAIEEALGIDGDAWKAPKVGNRFPGDDAEAEILARELRREWNLGTDPIPDMTELIEDRGIKVLAMKLPDGVSSIACLARRPRYKAKVPVIVVNEQVALERRRFALAHELAHWLMDENSSVDHGKSANTFAGSFLIHRDHLMSETGGIRKTFWSDEIIRLKRVYRVSAAAILVRLEQIGLIDKSDFTYAFQTYARDWRENEPEPLETKGDAEMREAPRRFGRLCERALREGIIGPKRACGLLRKPLAEIERMLNGPAEGDAEGG